MSRPVFLIKEVTIRKAGNVYPRFMVSGWINDRRVRQVCETLDQALGLKNRLVVAALNQHREPKKILTRLTEHEIVEAEMAVSQLKGVALSAAVDWYLANYRPPVVSKPLADAKTAFLAEREPHLSQPVVLAYRRTLKALCEAFPDAQVADIKADALERFFYSFNAGSKRRNNLRGELHTFFAWCGGDARRWIEGNPAKALPVFKISRGVPAIETAARIGEMFAFLETYAGGPRSTHKPGCLVPYFALATFAGIRPSVPHGEIWKLGQLKDLTRVIDLDLGVIRIGPGVAKTKDVRQVTIQPNLKAWMEAYPLKKYPIAVPGLQGMVTAVRKTFALSDDVLRHTFISMHVAKFGSVGRAALEAGNSEAIVKRHYLNAVSEAEATAFWNVMPQPPAARP